MCSPQKQVPGDSPGSDSIPQLPTADASDRVLPRLHVDSEVGGSTAQLQNSTVLGFNAGTWPGIDEPEKTKEESKREKKLLRRHKRKEKQKERKERKEKEEKAGKERK